MVLVTFQCNMVLILKPWVSNLRVSNPRSRYSRFLLLPNGQALRPAPGLGWHGRPVLAPLSATRPAISLSQLWTCQSCTLWQVTVAVHVPAQWQHGFPPRSVQARRRRRPGGQSAREGSTVWSCTPFAHGSNAVCMWTARWRRLPSWREDLSGSTPVGSALKTHGTGLCVMRWPALHRSPDRHGTCPKVQAVIVDVALQSKADKPVSSGFVAGLQAQCRVCHSSSFILEAMSEVLRTSSTSFNSVHHAHEGP
jgi:hypothetical protein